MKKIISCLLVVAILCSCFVGLQLSASAADLPSSGTCGDDVTYTFDSSTGLLTISGGGEMTNYYGVGSSPFCSLEIKTVVINSGVTSIGSYAFLDCSGLTSVTIPDSVTSIGSYAFRFCSGLTGITIPDSVTSIGDSAFSYCSRLTSVTIPDSVTSIGSYAFYYCDGLKKVNISSIEAWCKIRFGDSHSNPLYYAHNLYLNDKLVTDIVIPNSVTSIEYSAFYSCSSLMSISIPDSVTSIGDSAFYGCSGLTGVTIPDSVTSIGSYAFGGCKGLEKVNISSIEAWCKIRFGDSHSNPLYYAHNLYLNDKLVTDIVIPNSVTSIKYSAFYSCSSLTSISIPDSVTSIGNYAFYNCSGLTSVTIQNSVTSIGDSAFYGCSGLKELTMPCSAKIYNSEYTFKNCTNIEKITLTKGTGIMQNYGTSTYTPWYISKSNLKVVIEDGVKNIVNYAFYGCSGLTGITIPNSVTSIGSYAFSYCSSLTSISIPNSVTSIGSSAFRGCSGLTGVTIGNSVTGIGNYAFHDCSGLEKVNISSIEAWCKIRFGDGYSNPLYYAHNLYLNDKLVTDIVIPNSVTSIEYSAFYSCSSLMSISIPDSVTSIGDSAFYGCSGLTNVTIPNSVTSIGDSAFYGCSGLKELTMPCSAKIYNSEYTFKNCTNIEKITLTKGTGIMQNYGTSTSISATDTFFLYTPWYISKSNLKELVIEDGVKNIGNYAFYGCSGLTGITIPNSVTSIGDSAFYGCSRLTSVTIPNSVTRIEFNAFSGCTNLTIRGYKDSYAETFCKWAGIPFEVIEEPHMHSFAATVTTPTCTEQGFTTHTCSCGESYVDTYISALGHNTEAKTVVKPTGIQLGYTVHSCSRCGEKQKVDSYTAPTGKLTLKHSARTANAIKVQWNNVKTATGYQVQISTKDGKKWSTYATLKAGVTNYTFKSLAAGNNYKFRVRFYIKAPDGKNYFSPWSSTLTSPTLPTGTTLTKLTPAKKAFTVQWKNATVNGYQVQYSLKANFAGAKTITVKNPKLLKATASKLYAGKYYYVRIRTYKNIAKANYFSAWSKTYKVKTK